MKKVLLAIICLLIFSCKEDESISPFSKCDFETSETRSIKDKPGVLHYSKSINGLEMEEYTYYIQGNEGLPMVICNMPESIKLEEDGERAVIFSGRVVILPPNVDAFSTTIELHDLQF